ncbi:hypothetical protein AKO1_007953 [Acrasis kona]|uniref:Uncharacterized protein n=1 Tax=Acrasis kona TaxID=1008807 RepID=A0AAW2YQG4_9EUKA
MGVGGLAIVVSQEGFKPQEINLTDLAKRSNRPVSLVVDMNSIMFSLFLKSGFDSYSGGDYEQQLLYLTQFLENVEKSGVHLVLVIDGCTPTKKEKTYKERRVRQAKECAKVFEKAQIYQKYTATTLKPSEFFKYLFLMAARQFKNITIMSAPFEADPLMAKIAQERVGGQFKHMGVVTSDSDFMIYDSAGLVEPSCFKSINSNPPETIIKRVTPKMMLPLVACLSGNDYFSNPSVFYVNIEARTKALEDQVQRKEQQNGKINKRKRRAENFPEPKNKRIKLETPITPSLDSNEPETTSEAKQTIPETDQTNPVAEHKNKKYQKQEKMDRKTKLKLVANFVREYFETKNITVVGTQEARDFYSSIYKSEEKVNDLVHNFEEYNVGTLPDDHDHFDFKHLFKDYVPFNPFGSIKEEETAYEKRMDDLLKQFADQMKMYDLHHEVVLLMTAHLNKIQVMMDDQFAPSDTNFMYAELRKRFYVYSFFHDVNNSRDELTITEQYVRRTQFCQDQITVTRSMFKSMYGSEYPKNKQLDKKIELLRVYNVSKSSYDQLCAFLEEKLPKKHNVNSFVILIIVLNYIFSCHSIDEHFAQWEYECLIASFCSPGKLLPEGNPLTCLLGIKQYWPRSFVAQEVQGVFLGSNHLQMACRMVNGLKIFMQYNGWFGNAFDSEDMVGSVLLFNGTKFAKIYRKVSQQAKSKNIKKLKSDETYIRSILKKALEIVRDECKDSEEIPPK